MATKHNITASSPKPKKADDYVVTNVMIALVLLCISIISLRKLEAFYQTLNGFDVLYPKAPLIMACGLVLGAIGLAAAYFVKQRYVYAVAPWVAAVGLFVAVVGGIMWYSWVANFRFLYYLAAAASGLYIVFLLYRYEFFFVSLSTVAAGGFFLCYSYGQALSLLTIILLVVLLLALAGTSMIGQKAGKNRGVLVLGKKEFSILPAKFNPTIFYGVNALWLVCTIAALLLGNLFAYYCMFGALAVEFILAVYYTVQLN